jgi:hypothetical protein
MIIVVPLVKGLVDTINANGVLAIIINDVAVLIILVIVVIVALSKGLVVAIMLPLSPCTAAWPIPSPLHHAYVFLVGCCLQKIKWRPSMFGQSLLHVVNETRLLTTHKTASLVKKICLLTTHKTVSLFLYRSIPLKKCQLV